MISVDTGYFLALLNDRDAYRRGAKDWLEEHQAFCEFDGAGLKLRWDQRCC